MKSVFTLFIILSGLYTHAQTPEEILQSKGMILPEIPSPVANYVNAVRTGNLLFLSGKGPLQQNGKYITGKLGKDLSESEGYEAAKLTALIQLAVLKKELGSLSKVKQIVKVLGMVNSDSSFTNQPSMRSSLGRWKWNWWWK